MRARSLLHALAAAALLLPAGACFFLGGDEAASGDAPATSGSECGSNGEACRPPANDPTAVAICVADRTTREQRDGVTSPVFRCSVRSGKAGGGVSCSTDDECESDWCRDTLCARVCHPDGVAVPGLVCADEYHCTGEAADGGVVVPICERTGGGGGGSGGGGGGAAGGGGGGGEPRDVTCRSDADCPADDRCRVRNPELAEDGAMDARCEPGSRSDDGLGRACSTLNALGFLVEDHARCPERNVCVELCGENETASCDPAVCGRLCRRDAECPYPLVCRRPSEWRFASETDALRVCRLTDVVPLEWGCFDDADCCVQEGPMGWHQPGAPWQEDTLDQDGDDDRSEPLPDVTDLDADGDVTELIPYACCERAGGESNAECTRPAGRGARSHCGVAEYDQDPHVRAISRCRSTVYEANAGLLLPGAACSSAIDCLTGLCVEDGAGGKFCTTICAPSGSEGLRSEAGSSLTDPCDPRGETPGRACLLQVVEPQGYPSPMCLPVCGVPGAGRTCSEPGASAP